MQRDTITLTRQALGQWSSFIGAAGLLVGLLGLIWQGGLTPIIGAALVIGVGGVALWALLAPQDFIGFLTGRRTRYSTTAVLASLLMIGIVGLAYIILQRAVLTLDMTAGQRFTLSSETEAVLARVSRPIRITGFYTPASLRLREVDDSFFRLYEIATNGLITREYIDPDENPAQRDAFGVTEDGAVFISYLNPDGTAALNTLARVPRGTSQERDMTGAIARLLFAGTLTVYFETSHSSLAWDDTGQQGLSGINNGMRENGLITATLRLTDLAASGGTIPRDAAALILARPTNDLSEAEIQVLDEYLQRGGGLLILADALFNPNAFLSRDGAFSRYLWDHYGLRGLDAVVIEPNAAYSVRTPLDILSAAVFTDTDLGARLGTDETRTLFSLARALEVNESPPAGAINGRVIMSSPESYGETDLQTLAQTNTYSFDPNTDLIGPLTTVAWAANEATGGRIVLVGDADFVTNGQITTGGNGILFTDSISWLTRFGERISFAPQAFSSGLPLIFVDTATLDLIAFVTVILMPGLTLLAGLAVWTRRRRRI